MSIKINEYKNIQLKHQLCFLMDIHSHGIPHLQFLLAAPFPSPFPTFGTGGNFLNQKSLISQPFETSRCRHQLLVSESRAFLPCALHYPEKFSQGGQAAFPLDRIFRKFEEWVFSHLGTYTNLLEG